MSSFATKICSLTLPMKRSFQLVNALAVAASLAAMRLKGLASAAVDAHAAPTVSRKPFAFGQKASKRNRASPPPGSTGAGVIQCGGTQRREGRRRKRSLPIHGGKDPV